MWQPWLTNNPTSTWLFKLKSCHTSDSLQPSSSHEHVMHSLSESTHITFMIWAYGWFFWAWWHSSKMRSSILSILKNPCCKMFKRIWGVIIRTCKDLSVKTLNEYQFQMRSFPCNVIYFLISRKQWIQITATEKWKAILRDWPFQKPKRHIVKSVFQNIKQHGVGGEFLETRCIRHRSEL